MFHLANKGTEGGFHSMHLSQDRCQSQVQLLVTLKDGHMQTVYNMPQVRTLFEELKWYIGTAKLNSSLAVS